jgi:hypothetical protein
VRLRMSSMYSLLTFTRSPRSIHCDPKHGSVLTSPAFEATFGWRQTLGHWHREA